LEFEYTNDAGVTTSVDLTMELLMGEKDLDGNDGSMTWQQFEKTFWKSNENNQCWKIGTDCTSANYGLFEQLSYDTSKSESSAGTILFPTRRCFDEDYSELWRETELNGKDYELENARPPFCNAADYDTKPRTYEYGNTDENAYPQGERSLFPIHTRTRVEALARSNSAYFISIIIVQYADLMICKTRMRSLFEQGMTNTFMNYSLLFETILGAFLVYVPVANTVTGTRPLRFTWWTAGVPFSLMIYIYDEIRKGWIRKNQGGWIHRNTYW